MPHRLMQAVWQAQQALAQVQQLAEQLLREQEMRNNWYPLPVNQPNQTYYGVPYTPINQNWAQNQFPAMTNAMYPTNAVGTFVEPIFVEEQNASQPPQNPDQSPMNTLQRKPVQPRAKTTRKNNENE